MDRRRTPVTPDIVARQVVLEELDVAPDGRSAVVVRRTVAGFDYRRALWLVPLRRGQRRLGEAGPGRPRQLTSGLANDTHPRFSPDGAGLAFLSARGVPSAASGRVGHPGDRGADDRHEDRQRSGDPDAEGALRGDDPDVLDATTTGTGARGRPADGGGDSEPPTQVWFLPVDGGEPRRLTEAPHGVRGFAWSPDGRSLAYWAPAGPPRFSIASPRPGASPTARRIAVGSWHADEEGILDRRIHLFVARARPGGRARQLTAGDFDVLAPAWDANGRSLVFCAARHDDSDLFPRPSVCRVPVSGTPELVEVVRLRGLVESVTPSPDGRWLALLGIDVEEAPDDAASSLFVVPFDGSGTPRPLAPALDLPVGVLVDTDLHGWSSATRPGPIWVSDADGPALVALTSRRGRCVPWRYPLGAGAGATPTDPTPPAPRGPAAGATFAGPAPLVEADSACLAVAGGSGVIVALGTVDDRAPEVLVVAGGSLRPASSLGTAWQRRLQPPAMRNLEIAGPGGSIETWLASPDGAGLGPLPLVVDIHGGPLGGWAPAPSLEVQILASAGFRVALPNIRGSAGYGGEWIRAHMGHWGEVDAEDVLAVVDHLVGAGLAAPGRIGLLGLSYGGFLVSWLIGAAPDRFAAAVSEAGITNQVAAWALSDTGPDYNRRSRLGDPLTPAGADELWRRSPLRNVAEIRTPLLLLQGEADLRCPAADNEQLFVVLRALGRTVEYVTYPESHHVYSVAGRPDRRIDRHARMLAWFRRYLG